MSCRSPIQWWGSKSYLLKEILPLIPPHITFVDVFGGGANVILAKKPSPVDVYNDIDEQLVTFFRILRDQPNDLRRLLELTPYARSEYDGAAQWEDASDLEKSRLWYVRLQQSFSGKMNSGWQFARSQSRRGMSKATSRWLRSIDTYLPDVVERLRELQIENLDFETLIKKYDTPDTFFYCDPPYHPQTRAALRVYQHEMSIADHERLMAVLKTIKGKVMLHGYSGSYSGLGWDTITLSRAKHRIGQQEMVWVNYTIASTM